MKIIKKYFCVLMISCYLSSCSSKEDCLIAVKKQFPKSTIYSDSRYKRFVVKDSLLIYNVKTDNELTFEITPQKLFLSKCEVSDVGLMIKQN